MEFVKYAVYFVIGLLLMVDFTVLQSTQERTIQNPGYVELARCACDVKGDLCDFDCCCDNDCSAADKARFDSCIPGLFGGQGGNTEAYKCGTSEFNPPDWHHLTCVYWESNAYLGMYFMNKAKLTTLEAVTTSASLNSKDRFSLREQERRYVDKDFAASIYKQGIILTTRRNISAGQPLTGLLSLPQQINSGQCNPLAPVRFLKPFQSSCESSLTTNLCAALSVFDANTYLLSSTSTSGFQITSSLKGTTIAESEVRYFCTTQAQNENYLPSSTTSLNDLANTVSNFPNDLQNVDCSQPCSDATCTQYNTGRSYTSLFDTTLPTRCTFTTAPTPTMNTGVCQNVVLEVRYSFQWAGTNIQKLTADVILGDISSVTTTPLKLAQRFSVSWTHQSNITTGTNTATVDDNFNNSTQPYQRSGIAGYDPGKPLSSGCTSTTVNSTTFQPVDTQVQRQMAVFRPGVDGLCTNSQRESLLFGQDMMSSCALRLTYSQLVACEDLRTLVMNHLNVLMPSDVIGRYGYNDPTNQNMWISVMRQNLTEILTSAAASPIPVFTGNETTFKLADYVTGRCLLPTAVNLRVLYAQTGAINYHPLYEVIGAYVNYTVSNWTMSCMGSNSQRCSTTSSQVQNFFLESTVQFIKVPATPPTPQDSFYTRINPETCDSDTCHRYYEFWATDLCYYDTCWQQIAYPLTDAYDADNHEYALAVFLTLVLGVVGYASVTKPGWS